MPAKLFPAYLFLGEEDFLKEEAINRLKSRLLTGTTRDLNYGVFYAREKNFNTKEMLDVLNTAPFLSKKRIIVLKDADYLPAAAREPVFTYLSNPQESSVFVIESGSPVIKGDLLLKVSGMAHLTYFRRLTDPAMNTWLANKAALERKKITVDAINEIKENLPADLRTISSNMDSIMLYVGNRPVITKSDVAKVMGVSPSHTAFDLMDSIERKNPSKALRVFSALKKDKKKETELLGLMAWNARMLLRIKELIRIKTNAEIRRDLGLNPRMFERIISHAARFRKGEILILLKEILSADLDIKSGVSSRDVIERLIVKMCA